MAKRNLRPPPLLRMETVPGSHANVHVGLAKGTICGLYRLAGQWVPLYLDRSEDHSDLTYPILYDKLTRALSEQDEVSLIEVGEISTSTGFGWAEHFIGDSLLGFSTSYPFAEGEWRTYRLPDGSTIDSPYCCLMHSSIPIDANANDDRLMEELIAYVINEQIRLNVESSADA